MSIYPSICHTLLSLRGNWGRTEKKTFGKKGGMGGRRGEGGNVARKGSLALNCVHIILPRSKENQKRDLGPETLREWVEGEGPRLAAHPRKSR